MQTKKGMPGAVYHVSDINVRILSIGMHIIKFVHASPPQPSIAVHAHGYNLLFIHLVSDIMWST